MIATTNAFQYSEHGTLDVLKMNEIPLALPKTGELQIEQTAIGVNYIDIYQRCGTYPAAEFPAPIGVEGVGIVTAIGDHVDGFAPGKRVAYIGGPAGAYAQARNIPASRAVPLPDTIDDATAAALMFKAVTADYLIHDCYPVQPGQSALVHAGAGGVGSLLVQWLSAKGVNVIATVGREAKIDTATDNGATHVLLSNTPDFARQVRDLTGGVDVVYDSIGKDTFGASLDSLKPRGMMVNFGSASGPVPPISIEDLGKRGSLFLTRPSIAVYTADPAALRRSATRVFAAYADKHIRPAAITELPFQDAARAHDMLESRQTTGALILRP